MRDSIQKESCKEQWFCSVLSSNQVLCGSTCSCFLALGIVALQRQIATEIGVVLGTLTVTATVTVIRQPLDRSMAENTAS